MLQTSRGIRIWWLGIPFLILLSTVLIAVFYSGRTRPPDHLFQALTLDFVLTLPLSFWWVAGKVKLPRTLTAPVLVLGIVLATLLIPKEQASTLDFVKYRILPLIEILVLGVLIYKVVQFRKAYTQSARGNFYIDLKRAAKTVLPGPIDGILSFELGILYYAFGRPKKPESTEQMFSTYRDSGVKAILWALLLAVAGETVGLHLLLLNWSHTAAYVLTILSLYTGIQLIGLIRSLAHFPIVLDSECLNLNFGMFRSVRIPFELIAAAKLPTHDELESYQGLKFSLFYQNVILTLNQEVEVEGLYGTRKKTREIAFQVDDPDRFVAQLHALVSV